MSAKDIEIAKILNALSDANRIKIVSLLLDSGKCANTILQKMPFSQPTLSHHLSLLCEANVLNAKRVGKEIIYTVNKDTISKIASFTDTLMSANTDAPKKVVETPTVKVTKPKAAKKAVKVSTPKVVEAPAPVVEEPVKQPEPVRYQNDDFDFLD